ncbi:flagellin N-terminal helical domain-containing protein [Modestobacter sp. SYSU DS0875]
MALSVRTNLPAMSAQRHLTVAAGGAARSIERLSSGLRVNRAADDAAGLAVSEGLRAQIGGIGQALRNARDAISVVQTAEGALSASTSILQRMRDLAVQAANVGSLDLGARRTLQAEVVQLKAELTRIAATTTFAGTALLDGSYRGVFQVGADAGETIHVAVDRALDTLGLGLEGLNVASIETSPPAVVPARGRVVDPAAGEIRITGATTAPGGIPGLRGSVRLGAVQLDLASITYTSTDGVPGVSTVEALDQLNAAAAAAGITHRPDPFALDGADLVFRGPEPGSDAEADGAAEVEFVVDGTPPAGGVTTWAARYSFPPAPGVLLFRDHPPVELPELRGRVSADGQAVELGAVAYVDTDGNGEIGAAEALAQLNDAAQAAGLTVDPQAFQVLFHAGGRGTAFWGATPPDGATPDELAALTPVFTPAPHPIDQIDDALALVSAARADLGAVQNRLGHTIASLGVALENTTAARSRIVDADMAQEAAALARNQILVQAGTSMLGQATVSADRVLTLLGG